MKTVKLREKKYIDKEMTKNNKKMEHRSYILCCKVIKTHREINASASIPVF